MRGALLSTAAAGALSLALAGPALADPDACTTVGAVATCTGNQSDGITYFGPGTLSVNNLTQAIAPASGDVGINYISPIGAAITIISNTGDFGITTTGDSASGISAISMGFGPAVPVTVISTGNITTTGIEAYGIYALRSLSGPVAVTSTGNIVTAGSDANGIYANAGGTVTVTSTGNITTAGSDADGISAQGSDAITVIINSGTVSGGSGSGAGVKLVGGTDNTLTNRGTVTALSGLAIKGDTGNNTVNNFGTVTGNVVLGSGTNAFNNQSGGLFNAGATVDLGASNALANAGTLSPGGVGTIQTTALTGNLTQSATGLLLADIAGATSDRVNVSGTAALAGTVQVQVQNPILGPWQQTVLSATGGTTNNGLSLLASPALHAQLIYPNATDVAVQSSGINFLVPGLNGSQTAVAAGLNGAAQSAGLGGPLFSALLNGNTSLDGYSNALTQLSGKPGAAVSQGGIAATGQFVNAIFDVALGDNGQGDATGIAQDDEANAYAAKLRISRKAKDAYAAVTPRDRAAIFAARWNVWASAYGGNSRVSGDVSAGTSTTTSRIFGAVAGASYRLTPDTKVGFALGGAGSNFNLDGGFGGGKADVFNTAVYARHTIGDAYVAGLLGYSWQDTSTDRTVTIAGPDRLHASFKAQALTARLESGWRYATPMIGVTPYAALQSTSFFLPSYGETATSGSNQFALNYASHNVTATRGELGAKFDKAILVPGGVLTLKAKAAWAHDWNSDPVATATFQALPGANFTVDGAIPAADSALISARAEIRWRNGFALSGSFEGEFSDTTQSYGATGTLRYVFN